MLFSFKSFSQDSKEKFLKEFYAADFRDKVRLVAAADFNKIKDVYPQIRDTLLKIKERVYKNTSSNEAKFLFDKIEVNQEIYFRRFSQAALILENSLSKNANNVDDSLYCFRQLKEVYIKLSNLNKAIEANVYFDKLAIRTKDPKYTDKITKKSKIYDVFGLYNQAIIEKRKEFNTEYKTRLHDTDFIAGFFNDQGVYFNRLKNSDSALPYFNRASELITKKLTYASNQTNYLFFKGLIEGNMALAYTNQGQYKKAVPYLKTDAYYSTKVNDPFSAFNSYVLLAKCYIVFNQPALAKAYADTALTLNETIGLPIASLKALYLEAELYELENKHALAASKYKAYIKLKDSISNFEKEMHLINQQVALDIQKKDLEILEKNQLIKNAQIQSAKQNAFKAYLIAGLIILFILIVFLFYTNNSSKKREHEMSLKNQQIQKQNKLIEDSLREKEMLLKEIHHRVKNNLQIINSVLNLQSEKVDDEKLKDILNEIKLRISSIALTHQMLYQKASLNYVTLYDYIENLVSQISLSYNNNKIQTVFECNTKNLKLNIDTAIPLGLLVNEILTNAYKHSFKETTNGLIKITVTEKNNVIVLSIKDNGVGLPTNYIDLLKEPQTLGFELISILTNQIDAKLDIENQNGAEFVLTFTN